jgi:hypothetical protein
MYGTHTMTEDFLFMATFAVLALGILLEHWIASWWKHRRKK